MSKTRLTSLASTVALLGLVGGGAAARTPSFQPVVSGFTSPVGVTAAPGDPSTLYVVEQTGKVEIVRDGRLAGTFLDIRNRVRVGEELGLLGIAFHPNYAQNHLFYVDYTDLDGDTHVAQLSSVNGVGDPASAHDLLVVDQPYPNHKGGQLAFDARGLLYVGLGDGGTNPASGDTSIGDPENRAQSPGSMLGKLLRIDPLQTGAAWQIVGMGLRNPWRFSFDRLTGNLWLGDVGAARFEEIDFRPKAKLGVLANYGWSRFEGTAIYNAKVAIPEDGRVRRPPMVIRHHGPACTVIGGYVYRGAVDRGRYFYGDLCSGTISSFKVGPKGRASAVTNLAGRIRSLTSFGEDGNGELYAVSLDGGLYQLR